MSKHTPGPWRILIDGTCSGAWPFIGPAHLPDDELCDEAVAELGTTHTERRRIMRRGVPGTFAEKPARFEPTPDHDTIMANARLIAAAPDLLSVAYAIDDVADRIDHDPDSALGQAAAMARAAIAKATGE